MADFGPLMLLLLFRLFRTERCLAQLERASDSNPRERDLRYAMREVRQSAGLLDWLSSRGKEPGNVLRNKSINLSTKQWMNLPRIPKFCLKSYDLCLGTCLFVDNQALQTCLPNTIFPRSPPIESPLPCYGTILPHAIVPHNREKWKAGVEASS